MAATPTSHRWRFFRAGGLDQARFESAQDFLNLENLDQKLWVALACPVKGIELDEATLALIDLDKDGRIRVPEILAAIRWTRDNLKDLGALKEGGEALPLDQIQEATPSGKAILASARQILKNLGRGDATSITLADVSNTEQIFAQTRFNGDGIIPVESSEDPAVRQVLQDILQTQGSETDRSGKPGISTARFEAFFTQLGAYDAWAQQAEKEEARIRPLGEATPAAVAALDAVRTKVDDYFGRCRLAAFDPRAVNALNRKEEEYLAIAASDMHISALEVAGFPLARIEGGRPLPLKDGVNPAWTAAIGALEEKVITPLLGKGKTSLTEAEWTDLCARLAPYSTWLVAKPAVPVEALGLPRIREILKGPFKEAIAKLIEQDKALEGEANAIASVERLIRYYRDLNRLIRNFVNFGDFYGGDGGATFQIGTLYLDARACHLCVRVDDAGKHAALAGLAKTFLAYCDCSRPSGEKMTIAAAFTDGDSDNLMVGRNGVFYDRKGRDWDATITKIIENPISVRQAFWAPYKKLVRMIEEQVAKRAAAAEAGAEAKLAAAASATANVDKSKPAEPKKIDVGTVAALGVAFGALSTAIAAIAGYLSGVLKLPFWQVVIAFGALLMVISGPSMLIAWLKLRQRNLGPILDANGWAVNGRVKVPVSLGHSLTAIAKLPPGSTPALDDKFAEAPAFWPKFLGFLIVLGFIYSLLNSFGLVHEWTKDWIKGGLGKTKEEAAAETSLIDLGKGIVGGAATNTPAATNAPAAPAAPAAQ